MRRVTARVQLPLQPLNLLVTSLGHEEGAKDMRRSVCLRRVCVWRALSKMRF